MSADGPPCGRYQGQDENQVFLPTEALFLLPQPTGLNGPVTTEERRAA